MGNPPATAGRLSLDALPDRPPRRPEWVPLVVAMAVIHLAGVTNAWWPTPDSALYLGLGRNLAVEGTYTFNGRTNITVTPGLPVMLAGLHRLVGDAPWAANLLIAACGLATALLIYVALRRRVAPVAALAVTAAAGLSYLFYINAHRVLTDVPFALLYWAMLLCALGAMEGRRAWAPAAALLSAGAVAVRAPGAAIIVLTAVGLLVERRTGATRKHRAIIAAAIAVSALLTAAALTAAALATSDRVPHYYRLVMDYAAPSADIFLWRRLYGLAMLPEIVAEAFTGQHGSGFIPVGVVLLGLIGVGAVRCWRSERRLTAVLAVGYPLGLWAALGSTAMKARYLLPAQPLLMLAALEGVLACVGWIGRPARRASAAVATTRVLVAVLVLVNAPRVLRNAFAYSYLSHTGRFYEVIRDGQYEEMVDVARLARGLEPDAAVVLTGDDERVLAYLSRRRVLRLADLRPIRRDQADRLIDYVRSRPRAEMIVLHRVNLQSAFARRFESEFLWGDEWRTAYAGEHYIAYVRDRAGPLTRPAKMSTTSASP